MKKQAFTLAETVIVFVTIGVIAAITLRSINVMPDKEKILFKKAYSNIERVVGELINDESMYPYDQSRIGFLNTDEACIEGTEPLECFSGEEKFCQLAGRKLNTNATPVYSDDVCKFTTNDGFSFEMQSDFATNRKLVTKVDINGEEGPNVPTLSAEEIRGSISEKLEIIKNNPGASIPDSVITPEQGADDERRDIYYIVINYDGKVSVEPNSREEKYLRSHDTRKDRD